MTADEAGLLAAVREAPKDDLSRLVYADWCEDNGRPERAEFIRAQVWPEDSRRAYNLMSRFCERLVAPLDRTGITGVNRLILDDALVIVVHFGTRDHLRFRRGFIDEAHLPLRGWWDHGPALVGSHPIQRVRLTDREPERYLGVGHLWTHAPDRAPWEPYCGTFACCLPRGVYDCLSGAGRDRPYADQNSAKEDLSAAALLWAKKIATASRSVAAGD